MKSAGLSAAAKSCWGKSDRSEPAVALSLHQHMADSAGVAERVWGAYVPPATRRLVEASVGTELAGRVVVWLAAAHDLGKATRIFAGQVPVLADGMREYGLDMPTPTRTDRQAMPHSLAGQLLLERWLGAQGWTPATARSFAVVVGGHHGVTPASVQLRQGRDRWYLLGDGPWNQVHAELAQHAGRLAGMDEGTMTLLSQRPLAAPAQVVLTSLVILVDWIASNEELFRYGIGLQPSHDRIDQGWEDLGLVGPWEPVDGDRSDVDSMLRERFGLDGNVQARPVQRAVVDLMRSASTIPGLVVVEAPMGEGKTEAALLAAEELARRYGAGGVFVALPTMATSNAMFGRVLQWVRQLPDARGRVDQSAFLAHGKADLDDSFAGLMAGARVRGVGDDGTGDEVVVAHAWLRGRKKGVLANFVVGTIDQVLFAALRSRHLALRHLALVNKVVVIDEVHATDVYMGVYLERVLTWLGAYGVPTLLLSATLAPAQRSALVRAYSAGAARDVQPAMPLARPSIDDLLAVAEREPAATQEASTPDPVVEATGYPLLTVFGGGQTTCHQVDASARAYKVRLEQVDDSDATLTDLLRERLRSGGCAAVVRNTVRRAQDTYRLLREAFPDDDVRLLHSRLVAGDRVAAERELVGLLGPKSGATERTGRHLIVGTQVLEQSLDIDVDLMVTDLAPVDLVLQRIGRLHRHPRGVSQEQRPAPVRNAVCVLAGVDDWRDGGPVQSVAGSTAVYGSALLARSAWVLGRIVAAGGSISIPDDVPRLVRHALAEPAPPDLADDWQEAVAAADADAAYEHEQRRTNAGAFLLGEPPADSIVGWTEGSAGEADGARGQAQVRDGEDSLEVIVLRQVGSEVRVLPWVEPHGDTVVVTDHPPAGPIAQSAAACTLRLPAQMSRPWVIDRVIAALERNGFRAWQESPWLRGQLVIVLDENLSTAVGPFHLTYHRELGLEIERTEDA